jgi:pyoverdine/dityrosine biosynthesis protein Dit1
MKGKNINNSFNSGEMHHEVFTTPIRVDDSVSSLYSDQLSENLVEERILKRLNEEIYEIFKESEFHEKYTRVKRVDKSDMVKMYYFFKEKLLKGHTFSCMEIFVAYAEFFQINYETLYNEISVKDRELILRELNTVMGLDNRIKSKRLF